MKNRLKYKLISSILLTSTMFPLVLNQYTTYADERKISYVEESDCNLDTDEVKSDSAKTSGSVSTSEDAWLTEGTEQYAVAKRIFEIFTEEYGTSGAFAAGVLSNVKGESNFIPDVLEGGVRAGMNTPDGQSYNSAFPGREGGGGLFQFTGYSKFSHSKWWKGRPGSDGWAIENQVDAVWGLEFGNRAVENYFFRTGKSAFNTVEDLISTTDPRLASEYFQMSYERPESFHPERADWADKANSVFNKDNKKADPSKFKFDTGTSNAITIKIGKKTSGNDSCVSGKKSKSGGAWGNDGQGDHGFGDLGMSSKFFRKDELPENLKSYALDPTSIGMKYGEPTGWRRAYSYGQCTDLSLSVMSNLWSKNGTQLTTRGNGIDVAGFAASDYGLTVSKEPKAGAVFSSNGADENGHTGVVSHVFANGDFLIIEQNITNYSGDAIGQIATWNYRLVGKHAITSENYRFCYPDGWTVNTEAKTVK